MEVTTEYVSAACNQVPHVLSINGSNLIYGACNAIIQANIIENQRLRAYRVLLGHTDRVNCVRWLDAQQFVSCSTDKTVLLWKDNEVSARLAGHQSSVTVANGLLSQGIVVSGSADSTMKVWTRQGGVSWQCLQTYICPNSGFILDLCLIEYRNEVWIFASFDDCSVRLFSRLKGSSETFTLVHTLRGCEDWIQTLNASLEPETGAVLLASGCQDSFIRVWRLKAISKEEAEADRRKVKDLTKDEEIKVKDETFESVSSFHSVSVETILSGHDDKVFSVEWQTRDNKLILLSASLDKTIILWEEDDEGLWSEEVRVGEVGGNTLGFYGCHLNDKADLFVGHSFNGALHLWYKVKDQWIPGVTVGGHFDAVEDLDWDKEGRYFITTSKDQTTRVHACWQNKGWHEVARPQVHGYDLHCLTIMPNHRLASGADEKLVRVFEATQNFIGNIAAIDPSSDFKDGQFLAQGASVPSLGLSNKAVFEGETDLVPEMDKHVKDQFPDVYFKPEFYDQPPPEETLVQNTLWPEIQKVYGHGYEIFSIASNHSGTLLASACKAAQAEHANILLWNSKTWTRVASLANGHSLTVVQMAFSPDDKYLLTVSRDRTLCVWNMSDFSIHFKTDKTTSVHQRIIWACDWTANSQYFVTVGRDKKCVIWSLQEKEPLSKQPLILPHAATAVAVTPDSTGTYTSLVIGLENGDIYRASYNDGKWDAPTKLLQGHHKAVKRLKFKKKSKNEDFFMLATCGNDHLVQLIKLV